jgi:hypothetical protein
MTGGPSAGRAGPSAAGGRKHCEPGLATLVTRETTREKAFASNRGVRYGANLFDP